jgi:hypothetical protein
MGRALRRPSAGPARPRAQRAADDRLYFAARSIAANGLRHILQYAFVDDRGNVVMSLIAEAPSPVAMAPHEPPDPLAVDPVDPVTLDCMLSGVCAGASLVAFGRVLQIGLLPPAALAGAAQVDCAWRRYMQLVRKRRAAFDRHQPVTLSDALAFAGLKPPESEDAAVRALAVRDLWMWMDAAELRRAAM